MSKSRRDLHKQKLRQERIRREKHAQRTQASTAPILPPRWRYAAERSGRYIHTLLGDTNFESMEEANRRIAELTADGRLEERARAWKSDDPKWLAQELAYDAMEAEDLTDMLRLVVEAVELDPDCTEAQRMMVEALPASVENKILLMREAIATAEKNFGEEFLRENKGRFWGIHDTRPYMRAKASLAFLLLEAGRTGEAIAEYEHMLELNPDDNQGIRYELLPLYLAETRLEEARALLSRFEAESGDI